MIEMRVKAVGLISLMLPLPSNLCHMDLTVNYVFCISFSFYKVVTPDVPLDILTLTRMQWNALQRSSVAAMIDRGNITAIRRQFLQ